MEERAGFLIEYANAHAPVTVRQLFYAAGVAGVAGIDKTEHGYDRVQSQVLKLRRCGRMPYSAIADSTRYMHKPSSWNGPEEALQDTARLYRKSLWAGRDDRPEIWLEKSALAGAIYPVTSEYDVPLMPTAGFTSETFAFEAVEAAAGAGRRLVVLSLYDFDRSGQDAALSLQEKVSRFGEMLGVETAFYPIALDHHQVVAWNLPTRPPKRNTAADRRWPWDVAAELDAIPPASLRTLVRSAIEAWLPADELAFLKTIEAEERETLARMPELWGGA